MMFVYKFMLVLLVIIYLASESVGITIARKICDSFCVKLRYCIVWIRMPLFYAAIAFWKSILLQHVHAKFVLKKKGKEVVLFDITKYV